MDPQRRNTAGVSSAADLQVPILIVGGGGAGLTASILLSRLGVRRACERAADDVHPPEGARAQPEDDEDPRGRGGRRRDLREEHAGGEHAGDGLVCGAGGPGSRLRSARRSDRELGRWVHHLNWIAASPVARPTFRRSGSNRFSRFARRPWRRGECASTTSSSSLAQDAQG